MTEQRYSKAVRNQAQPLVTQVNRAIVERSWPDADKALRTLTEAYGDALSDVETLTARLAETRTLLLRWAFERHDEGAEAWLDAATNEWLDQH